MRGVSVLSVGLRLPWREEAISAPAMGSTTKYRSRLLLFLSLASCILSVSLAKSEARYRGYSGYRRNFSPGYFRGYRSSYGGSDYHHKVQHHQQSGLRKYGYKFLSSHPPAPAPAPVHEGEQDRFIPAPVKPSRVSPSFSIDVDLASDQPVPAFPSNKIDIELNNPSPPPPPPPTPFPARIQKPQPITNPISIPAPVPAVPAVTPQLASVPQLNAIPAVAPQLSPVPAVAPKLTAVPAVAPELSAVPAVVRSEPPLLPQAFPAVPGRPILSDSTPSESEGKIFVPMPVPAVPGL